MCRYDDDYEWYVETTNEAYVAESDTVCEDCKRVVATGETMTYYTAMQNEDEFGSYVWVSQMRLDGQRFLDMRRPWTRVDDDRADELDGDDKVFLDEVHENELVEPEATYHYQCAQCYAGNTWLRIVCDQHTVLVTHIDLIQHDHEYTREQLGPDFGTLVTLARQQWRTRDFRRLIPAHVVKGLAEDAARFALANGLDAA